jgi:hypothetical protein
LDVDGRELPDLAPFALLGRRGFLAAMVATTALPTRVDAIALATELPAIDYSHAGYAAGLSDPPRAPVVIDLSPDGADDHTALIQEAIDSVGRRSPAAAGMRGAVRLGPGTYRAAGRLVLDRSGVVLRGSPGAMLIASGADRGPRIRIGSARPPARVGQPFAIPGPVPAGSTVVTLAEPLTLDVGAHIAVVRPSTPEWIAALGMDQAPGNFAEDRLHWTPGSRDLVWQRQIVAVAGGGRELHLDAPITAALDPRFGGGYLVATDAAGLPTNIGVEELEIASAPDSSRPLDEDHAWIAIAADNARDIWIRNVTARHFVASAVRVHGGARRVLVDGVQNLEPISEVGSYRRQSFVIEGQQVLVHRCVAEQGLNDFSTGLRAAGPNVFLDCTARRALGDSGGWESWSSGTLFENVTVEGAGLRLAYDDDRTQAGGWTTANSMLWNCTTNPMIADRAPTGPNEARIAAHSCYREQLRRRHPLPRLASAAAESPASPTLSSPAPELPVHIVNGRFVAGGRTVWGGALNDAWWRGQANPADSLDHGRSITRFVPGREGPGLTEDLVALAAEMAAEGMPFHQGGPGLWYDRRRDDHTMDRRPDGDVWAPFYELPWSRSGTGQAWDGLSLHDLTRFNPWYFGRLQQFAQACAGQGHVLFHNLYNTHNLLEIVPHWADYPWRPANNINDTGLPEPMPIEPGGRLNLANQFYSVEHPPLRDLHRGYIRHVLDQLGACSHVFFNVGFQYAGPLAFQLFFLQTIAEWEQQTGQRIRVVLATSKDITDAVLADERHAAQVAVIDTRYWQYRPDGELWAPQAGQNKAFRELIGARFGRISDAPPPTTPEQAYAQVREYRTRFPDKAVVAWHNGVGEVPALMAGAGQVLRHNPTAGHDQGRRADTTTLDLFLRRELAGGLHQLEPAAGMVEPEGPTWCLARSDGRVALIASMSGAAISASGAALSAHRWTGTWFSPTTGETRSAELAWPPNRVLPKPDSGEWLLLLKA